MVTLLAKRLYTMPLRVYTNSLAVHTTYMYSWWLCSSLMLHPKQASIFPPEYVHVLVEFAVVLYSLEIGLHQNLLRRAFGIQDCVWHSESFPGLMQAFSSSMDVVSADILKKGYACRPLLLCSINYLQVLVICFVLTYLCCVSLSYTILKYLQAGLLLLCDSILF